MGRSRTAWVFVAAVVLGSLVVPRVAGAVTSLVTIQNNGGTQKAGVTDAKQLQVAEAEPSSFHEFVLLADDGNCHVVATIPANKGFVMRSIALDVITPSTSGLEAATLSPNGSCSGGEVYSVGTHTRASDAVSLDPGFAVAPGGKLSLKSFASAAVAVHIWGYFVPAGDVPSTTGIN